MGFLSPWFLGGLFAVGLPVYLHLLRQHKSEPLPFASLMFFEPRTQSSIKHRRLRYLLLMALRIALFALLALAFASPFVRRSVTAGAGRKLHLIAVDRSFSMRAAKHLEAAKDQALSAIASLPGADQAQVLALDSRVELLSPASNDKEPLRAALRAIAAGDGHGSYADLVRAVKPIAQAARVPVSLDFFTDAQKSAMPPGFVDLQLPPNVDLKVHSVAGSADVPNWYVENVSAPQTVYSGRKVRVQATVAGSATPAAKRQVTLLLNGRSLETKTVDVPASGRASAEFQSLEAPFGMNRAEVRIDSTDALAEDDHFLFAVERAEPRKILYVHGGRDNGGSLYYRTALDATTDPAFTLEVSGPGEVGTAQLDKYALIVLADTGALPEGVESNLKRYVQRGGAVWIAAGPLMGGISTLPVAGYKVNESKVYSRSGERFQSVANADPEHPAFKNSNRWEGVKFYQAAKVDPGAAGRVIARLSDETPVLIDERRGEGRIVVFASTFDNLANDFPLHPSFVPFVQQTARYLSGLVERPAHIPVGGFIELRRGNEKGASVEVIAPDGKRAMGLDEAARSTSYQPLREGFFEVRRASGHNDMIAVNADRRESDLARIPDETLALWQKSGAGGQSDSAAATDERRPFNLWWYVMLVVLALSLVESWFAARYLSLEREEKSEPPSRKVAA